MTSITVGPDPEQLLQLARTGSGPALGELLDLYRGYLAILARVQIGLRLQGKVDPSDLVQDAFLQAHHGFGQFRGTTEKELVSWLRQIMASNLANLMRHYWRHQALKPPVGCRGQPMDHGLRSRSIPEQFRSHC
jgi:RNA polymerase sigma-70 factor, ECF subfamily